MAPTERVLKFTRSDDASKYVLLNVIFKGPKPLDIKIQATEGEAEYGVSIKHGKVGSLRVKNCPATESEWQQILGRLLQQEPQPDIQATATVSEGSSISVVIRKSIQGITQRLGSITIPEVPGGELNVLDWCAAAVDAAVENKTAAFQASRKAEQLESEVADLKAQLEELLKAKDEDETALLLKFRDLLNEKKVKIREQQKIIASNPTTVAATSPPPVSQTALPERSRKAAKSRPTKRKAPVAVAEEDSSDDGFEAMEVDKAIKNEPEETDKGTDTDGTASTASDEDEAAGESASGPNTAAFSQRPKSPPKKAAAQPPPKRSLPFTKEKRKPAVAAAPAGEESETESDDEL